MLGCFVPCHKCIDNAIHTFSGVQLRLECNRIMKLHGHKEQTGTAKIAKHTTCLVITFFIRFHPIVYGHLTDEHLKLLASCYRSCLELAESNGVKSIAFCCISTGEFHFPNDIAAQIAVETAKDYLKHSELERVILMFLRIPTKKSMKNYSDEIIHLKEKLDKADAVVIGAGAGLSTAAGFTYAGERFEKHFSDFKQKYGFTDMYSGGFYPFETLEEYWAYWSRYIYINRYMDIPNNLYDMILSLVNGKDYFLITTNVDHCFQKAGFDKKRLFYTQGDYGLLQCPTPCCNETFDNEDRIKQMYKSQSNMKIPTELIPLCPHCKKP